MEKVCKWKEHWLACTNLNMVSCCTFSGDTGGVFQRFSVASNMLP